LDGHPLASVGAQLGGNSLVWNTLAPLRVALSAGRHSLSVRRAGSTLAPGDGGAAVLYAIFLTPAQGAGLQALRTASPARWRSLCGHPSEWIEAVRA